MPRPAHPRLKSSGQSPTAPPGCRLRLLEAGHDGRPNSLKADAVRSFLSAIGSRNQFLPLALDLRNALRRRRQIFWHCAPELFDGLADFAADLKMHSVRLELVFHALAAQLILRLRGPKEIGSEFGAAHVVENFIALLQSFSRLNLLGAQFTVEAAIAVILKSHVILGSYDSRLLRRRAQRFVVLAQLAA